MTVLCAAAVSASSTPRAISRTSTPLSSSPGLEGETPKKKGARVFTKEEKDILAEAYEKECFPLRRDLEELARRFGKPVRKVKTWFNNRRSLDRKSGRQLVRPTKADRKSVLGLEDGSSGDGGDEKRVEIRAGASGDNNKVERISVKDHHNNNDVEDNNKEDEGEKKSARRQGLFAGFLSGTPRRDAVGDDDTRIITPLRSLSREMPFFATPGPAPIPTLAPIPTPGSIAQHQIFRSTPVTNGKPATGMTTPTPRPSATPNTAGPVKRPSSGRAKLSPARFRRVALEISGKMLEGEDHKVRDNGLELKFLYGKRKISYEWYVGPEGTDSSVTGGPFTKMEINFDSIWRLNFVRGPNGCLVEVFMSDAPQMLLQTEVNISQFQNRTQQRQYRRVKREEGLKVTDIDMNAQMHRIYMRADDAARVHKTLLEQFPELGNVLQVSYQTPQFSTPSFWPSPVTSIMSTPILNNPLTRPLPSTQVLLRGSSSMLNVTSGFPMKTPQADQQREMPAGKRADVLDVRKNLDFGTNQCLTPRTSSGLAPLSNSIEPITGKKRGLLQAINDENDPNEINRQRLRFTSAPMITPSLSVPPPPLPPPLPGMQQLGLTVDPRFVQDHWRQPQVTAKHPASTPERTGDNNER